MKMIPLNFQLTEIGDSIYRLRFGSRYHLAMHFLRMQEYYESPKYRGLFFTLIDYMEWYASEHKGLFSYPSDWSGFNVPGSVMEEVHGSLGIGIQDYNKYDSFMHTIYHEIKAHEISKNPDKIWTPSFYLIGTSDEGYRGDGDPDAVLNHELAHAFWYLDEDYQDDMSCLLDNIPKEHYDTMFKTIHEMGYHKTTCRDEAHAYCATGPSPGLVAACKRIDKRPFADLFKEKMEKRND
jgi:hypothetical protein